MTPPNPIIEIRSGKKVFGSFTALSDINLSIQEGEILTLLGPSGCGKTTLMRMVAGFDGLTEGSLRIGGVDVAGVPPERRPVNMVFQRYALFPHLDVFENVAFGLKVKGLPKSEIKQRVQRILHIVQLESFADRYIDQISGGQSQRVALARALVNGPKVLLLDEPLAALDLKIRQHMLAEMKRIHAETGATFIYVTHDQDEAMILSDRVALMEKGRIVQLDRPEDMYAKPKSLFAAKFLGETNLFEAKVTHVNGVGTTAVTPSGIRFVASGAPNASQDDGVTISLRPESLSFQAGDAAPQSVEGTVEDIVFIGSRSFYTVRLDDRSTVRIQVQRNGRTVLPALHARTKVFWDAANVVMLPQR
ncbi:ABC transporter ATP-binding protein [Mesorhizobium sp.]|uniref:ABC transporter ATP-binding protein n=1 Tax=Mesorhizobium sp. TaxID=1871066 RepID=UPI000FE4F898|nr:ABC transporter ATP-binding protein [Mesorhizobium sp.]RWD31033.1 MAG: ABC transporter ATP-binding protein [Mesorhizobium sp.]TIS42488.1 MAG: ABC transporter ATP-binding protein [Mesorhizobium sp.]